MNNLVRAELYILSWLEARGYQYDLFTDIDFDRKNPVVVMKTRGFHREENIWGTSHRYPGEV